MTSPFDVSCNPDNKLINIATGIHATSEVKNSLLSAVRFGQDKFENFIEERFDEISIKGLYETISRSSIITFSELNKKTILGSSGSSVKINSEVVLGELC